MLAEILIGWILFVDTIAIGFFIFGHGITKGWWRDLD